MKTITLNTSRPVQAVDVTDRVNAEAQGDGFLWLSCPHTTAALLLSEVDDELVEDLERTAAELLEPFEPYRHGKNGNPNAQAHLVSSLVGTSHVLRVEAGRVRLGTYQRILFLELDGPRVERRIELDQFARYVPEEER